MLMLAAIMKPFVPGWAELSPFLAELTLIATVVAVLIVPFFVHDARRACAFTALTGLLLALAALLGTSSLTHDPAHRFAHMLVNDHAAVLFKALLLIFTMGVVLMWFCAGQATETRSDGPEFFTLLVGAALGMCLMGSSNHLLMLLIAVELASLPSYVMAGFRKTVRVSAEASLKYVLFGAASSALMIYGISMLYGLSGSLGLPQVSAYAAANASNPLLALGLGGLLVGLAFKISAVPLHFWCPDVFEGSPIEVTTFLSVASKGAGLILLARVAAELASTAGFQPTLLMTAVCVVIGSIGALTATVGNLGAFVQNNLKRLLAYSSIAHAGYMMCALSVLISAEHFAVRGTEGFWPVGVLLFYLATYLFMNLGAFVVVALVARQTGSEHLDAYVGLARRSPLLAVSMVVFLFSLVGLPPLAGFVAKVNVFWLLIQAGGWWWALVAVVGVNTVLSLYVYMRIARAMFLRGLDGESSPNATDSPVPTAGLTGTCGVLGPALCLTCAAALVLMFIFFSPVNELAMAYSLMGAR